MDLSYYKKFLNLKNIRKKLVTPFEMEIKENLLIFTILIEMTCYKASHAKNNDYEVP